MSLHALLKGVLLFAAAYGILVLLAYLLQPHLLYFPHIPSRAVETTPTQVGLAFESVTLTTEDGVTIEGWYLPSSKERGTVLFLHGNAGNISHRLDSLSLFHHLGLSSFIIDYRGYGRSQGHPTETGTYLDAQAAWQYLIQQRQIPEREIILFGRSLGGAIAAQLADHTQPGALMVESAFTSIPDLAAELYPFLPARWLARFQYPTQDFLQRATCPVLIIHSRDDEIIPFTHGQVLFKAAPFPKQFLVLNGGHNDAFLVDNQKYLSGIKAFLQTYFGQKGN
ncbi:alpha/beta hydrolase [Nitrosococcus wardiae]|uniref:Alpha/beta hydrolase n=1 Tax=Nitrosococcus wardiae TaxID=1814290 RepID=A0A4P7BYT4_9GAMM|nr:alpha/beta hydrolase [Nitrosococcus wardiae]QBQ53662.1 alpha/beta hydrolase [Nitrosococcus wardiae]